MRHNKKIDRIFPFMKGDLYDHQLAALHAAGLGQEFEIGNGWIKIDLEWNLGERMNTGANVLGVE